MELITINNGVALLDEETHKKIAEFERKIKEIKEAEEDLRERILKEMESKGIKQIKTDEMTISYKAPYDKESFDSKQFRADHPDIYDSYISMTTCKASVSIKLKEVKA